MDIANGQSFRIRNFGEDAEMRRQLDILVVEDDPHIVLALSAILEDLGHRVVRVVDTAAEAIRASGELPVDLALVDVWLADGSNGLTAVEHLSTVRKVPSVVCSAHSSAEDAYAAGASAFLEKPFRVADLERALAAAFAAAALAANRLEDGPAVVWRAGVGG